MAMSLQDFKLMQQDTRLVLFGSTVFKLKCRTSHDLRESLKVHGREEDIQEDLKRIIAAVLSCVVSHNTLPLVRTDNIAVYTGSCPWTVCGNLYFAHQNQPLRVHPCVILLLVSLVPPPHQKCAHTKLGKHKRGKSDREMVPLAMGEVHDECTVQKKMRTDSETDAAVHVPDPSAACLPTGSMEGGRRDPDRQQVMAAAELSKERLHALSQPCWNGAKEEAAVKQSASSSVEGRSLFQYVKRFLGWM